jgi:hypothetical protein
MLYIAGYEDRVCGLGNIIKLANLKTKIEGAVKEV